MFLKSDLKNLELNIYNFANQFSHKINSKIFKKKINNFSTFNQFCIDLESYNKDYENFSVDTVERYQGSAREVIVLSLCLNHIEQLDSLVSLSTDGMVDRKLNVALTRARKHLVIIGNEALLSQSDIYNSLIRFIRDNGGVFNNITVGEYF